MYSSRAELIADLVGNKTDINKKRTASGTQNIRNDLSSHLEHHTEPENLGLKENNIPYIENLEEIEISTTHDFRGTSITELVNNNTHSDTSHGFAATGDSNLIDIDTPISYITYEEALVNNINGVNTNSDNDEVLNGLENTENPLVFTIQPDHNMNSCVEGSSSDKIDYDEVLIDNLLHDPDYTPSDQKSVTSESSVTSHEATKDLPVNETEIVVPQSDAIDMGESVGNERHGRKRKADPTTWKRNSIKNKRLSGEEYVNRSGNVKGKRSLGHVCKCRRKCFQQISENDRAKIHEKFWSGSMSWQQKKQFVAMCITIKPLARIRPRNNRQEGRRKFSYEYNFSVGSELIQVCKVMFKSTLSITEKFIQNVQSQKNSNPGGVIDNPKSTGGHNRLPEEEKSRIRSHISSFPSYESHYSRERTKRRYLGPELNITKMYNLYKIVCAEENVKPASKQLYRNIFNYEFNLGFHMPSVDSCDTCDKLQNKINSADDNDTMLHENELKAHQEEATKRYKLKKEDKLSSRQPGSNKIVLTVDLQKCLPTPYLLNSEAFYLRKLWTLNFTIHNATLQKSYCMIWHEALGGRGGQEIGSCLIQWADNYLQPEHKELSIWSDNCTGQNRNFFIIAVYFFLLKSKPHLNSITHNFLLRGHTHMEVDSIHSVIERKKKRLETMKIHTPRDWSVFISACKEVNPLMVHEMGLEEFQDVSKLLSGPGSPFVIRKINDSKEKVQISKMVCMKVVKEEIGVLYYKLNFDDEFSKLDLRRNTRTSPKLPDHLVSSRNTLRPISKQKHKDLMKLLQWVDKSVHSFFINLPTKEGMSELPQSDDNSDSE